MKLSYNWLKEYVPKLPKPEKLAELLTFHVVEVESIEKIGNDWVLSMDVLPNRAHDLNSHLGVAKEIAALTGEKLKVQSEKLTEDKKKKTTDMLSVRIEDAEGCPRYIGRYIEGVKVAPSPKWMQERLVACGMRPINNVVDATNYVMLEMGQPLHAFDAGAISNTSPSPSSKRSGGELKKEIIVRKAKKGEKFITLDDQKFDLDGSELLIADSQKALAIAGIKGGKHAGVTTKTKNLILEAANFDQTRIRRTSQPLGLLTDASKRFSGGLHPVVAERAMERLTALIGKLAGGTVYGGAIDAYPKKWPVMRVLFDPAACNAILGTNLKETEMKKSLESLGCRIEKAKPSRLNHPVTFLVTPPAERFDLSESQDLYEEVGRMFGWENISAKSPHVALTIGKEAPMFRLNDLARKILSGMGYSEHVGYALMGEQVGKIFKKAGFHLLELANPLTEDAKYLRPAILPSLLEGIAKGAKHRSSVRLFEIGKHFFGGEASQEHWGLGIMLYIKKESRRHEAWFELKGLLDTFFAAHGLADARLVEMSQDRKEALRPLMEAEGLAEIQINGNSIGSIGAVGRQLKDLYDIEGAVVRAHISMDALRLAEDREREFAEIPRFPSVIRDVAVIIPVGTKLEAVQSVIEREGSELLWDVDVFDIYEGAEIGENNESMAFHLVFQSPERTLTDKEVSGIMDKIIEALKKEGWEIRE
ncbi:MAG: phenylalanine--tRNA ligase subunit beta [bacterium]|nr:phenylalanine--tRNA ligase subunit beta [bacterium]